MNQQKQGAQKLDIDPCESSQDYIDAGEIVQGIGRINEWEGEAEKSEHGKNQSSAKLNMNRRDLMRVFGLSAAAGASACVRRPAEKAIPYVNQPVDHIIGVPTYYATTCGGCSAGCGIVAKTKEGRVNKLEGSPKHYLTEGALCALGQAQVQALNHPERLDGPQYLKEDGSWEKRKWEDVYGEIASKLRGKKKIAIVMPPSTGHRARFLSEVLDNMESSSKYLYSWDSNSLVNATAEAYKSVFGERILPRVELKHAKMILGIGSDFQEVGLSPTFYSKGFTKSHSYHKGDMGHFVQFEAAHTLTGARADSRHVIPPKGELLMGLALLQNLYEEANARGSDAQRSIIGKVLDSNKAAIASSYEYLGVERSLVKDYAKKLLDRPSVVLMGGSSNFDESSTQLQIVAILVNQIIGAFGQTIFIDDGWFKAPSEAASMKQFLTDASELDAVFFVEVDPVASMPKSYALSTALRKIPLVVSMQSFPSAVDHDAHYALPVHHPLESWGDEQPIAGYWSSRQPVTRPITDSRQSEDVMLWILAHLKKSLPYKDYRTYMRERWEDLHKDMKVAQSFEHFFHSSLKQGFVGGFESRRKRAFRDASSLIGEVSIPERKLRLLSPLDHRLLDGRGAHLPVLQEIGDGMTTIAWDTWLALNPKTIEKMGLRSNQVVYVQGAGGQFSVAIYPLPGLHPDAAVVPRGNGGDDPRSTISYLNGVNPLAAFASQEDPMTGQPVTSGQAIKLVATKEFYRFAVMQKKNEYKGRADIIKRVSLAKAPWMKRKKDLDDVPDLFPALEVAEQRWGMSVDLGKCNGCGACMAACAIENNVPQVGRTQIILGREMHWIRLDRYFGGDESEPTVTFQPVMCQHCNHAPCEAVCPVFATQHDPEGLNAMTYNRCVGTRYCANACPYKVRRFNWWTHKWGEIGEHARDRNPHPSNPDVTVRTKGVMEKCTMCVQRLHQARHDAKYQNRPLVDADVTTACQQTCPMDAIVVGNLNDKKSKIYQERQDARAFLMLGGDPDHEHYGLKTLPNVSYKTEVVRGNRAKVLEKQHHSDSKHHG